MKLMHRYNPPKPGEMWVAKANRHRAVRIISVDPDRDSVFYEYVGGMNSRLRNRHRFETFHHRYERVKGGDDDE